MTSQRSLETKLRILPILTLFIAILTALIAPAALAQQAGTSLPSAQHSASTPARPVPPRASNAQDELPASLRGKKSSSAAPEFSFSRSDIATGLSLWGTVLEGDFNRDGKPDLLVTVYPITNGPVGIDVLLGNGDGTFSPPSQVFSGLCTGVAVADFNGDGKLDFICSGLDEQLWVFLGNGDGTFTPGPRSPSLITDVAPLVADFNGDGKLDVALILQGGGIAVGLGNGDGTFGAFQTFPDGCVGAPAALEAADFNGDGKLDLSAVNYGTAPNYTDSSVNILLGNGDGTFGLPTAFPVGNFSSGVVAADFNGDHKVDLAVSNTMSSSVSVLLGKGDGTFLPATDFSVAYWPYSVATADFSGDGNLDLAIIGGSSVVSMLPGNGDGTFGPYQAFSTIANSPASFIISDLNLDGKPDMAVVYSGGSGTLSVFLNTTSAAAETRTALASSLNPSTYGQKVTWTATVTTSGSLAPTGKVNFTWSGHSLGEVTLNSSGVATLTRSALNADTYPLTAVYGGDANHLASTSAVLNQVVTEATSSAALTSSPNPSTAGQAVTFTATIKSPTVAATGPVTFTAGKTVLGTAQLADGKATFTISTLAVSTTKVTASYYGDSNISGSSASVLQTVTGTTTTTAATLTWLANPPQKETFTATITSPKDIPTGSVTFAVGTKVLGTVRLSNGVAKLSTSTLAVGSNTVTATYNGDANNAPTSAWATQTFVMPVTGTLYLLQMGGSAGGITQFGLGTTPANFVEYYSGLPNTPNPTGEVLAGSFAAGTIVNLGVFTQFIGASGWAFSTGTDQASIVAFADLANSLGMNHSITQQTSSTTWLLHLDDALSYLYDDDNNDVLMQLRIAPK
jgi:hypothetical protein